MIDLINCGSFDVPSDNIKHINSFCTGETAPLLNHLIGFFTCWQSNIDEAIHTEYAMF